MDLQKALEIIDACVTLPTPDISHTVDELENALLVVEGEERLAEEMVAWEERERKEKAQADVAQEAERKKIADTPYAIRRIVKEVTAPAGYDYDSLGYGEDIKKTFRFHLPCRARIWKLGKYFDVWFVCGRCGHIQSERHRAPYS